MLSAKSLDVEKLRKTFQYIPESGRMMRVSKGRGAKIGRLIGHEEKGGHRRAHYAGRGRMTAHLVWAWHTGNEPEGILKHKNGVNSDDRFDNLEPIRRPLQIAIQMGESVETEYGRIKPFTSGIYEIVCLLNGRSYIGSAVNIDKRWTEHMRQLETGKHHSKFLQRAFIKHGAASFAFRVLLYCSKENLLEYEQRAIDGYKPDYNSVQKAGSQLGFKHSDESRRKMSASRGPSSHMLGKRHTEETKAKISSNRKGKGGGVYSKERIEKTAAAMRASKGALSESSVRQGRELRASGATIQKVSESIGCSFAAAYDFIRGRTFAWVK